MTDAGADAVTNAISRLLSRVDRADLDWLVQQVWSSPGDGVLVAQPAPPGSHVVEAYRVVPSVDRPWIVVPALGRRATVQALLSRRRLASSSDRFVRTFAAAALGLGPRRRSRAGTLLVTQTSTEGAQTSPRLLDLLTDELGGPVFAVVLLGARSPNRKPTLELVTAAGRTVGFAKLGWNAATRWLVGNEAQALRTLQGLAFSPDLPRSPALLSVQETHGLAMVVTAPIPRTARRWPKRSAAPGRATQAVAAAMAANGAIERQPLHRLGLWLRQRAELQAVDGPAEWAANRLLRALDEGLRDQDPQLMVPVGGWHGDWTPWNLASAGGEVWAFDWEHSSADVPLGFDVLHYHFAVSLHVERLTTAEAVHQLRATAGVLLEALDVPRAASSMLVTGYLVEQWLRAHRLHVDGGGWDRQIHPGLVEASWPDRPGPQPGC